MKKEEIVMGLYAMRLKGKNRVAKERNNTVDRAIELINQLDEPKQTDTNVGLSKPVIPQFVADFIRATKPSNSLRLAFEYIAQRKIDNYDDELALWVEEGNSELFARAWLDGYEVEKEKKYIVKFAPSVFGTPTYGSIGTQNGKKIMQSVYGSQGGIIFPNQYTRREIEEVGSIYMIFAEDVTERVRTECF